MVLNVIHSGKIASNKSRFILKAKYVADQSYLYFEQCKAVSELITISATFFNTSDWSGKW